MTADSRAAGGAVGRGSAAREVRANRLSGERA